MWSATPAPGRAAEIHADVDALRLIDLGQHLLGGLGQHGHLHEFVARQRRGRGEMAPRHDQQVAGVVGEEIEDDEGGVALMHDERRGLGIACALQNTQPCGRRCASHRRDADEA